jgi:phosphopantothenoylcysteine synthetase/decarboxylase
MSRLAVITCGPAYAPIDSVRRISNFATGEIGTILSQALKVCGLEVICFRGEGSIASHPDGVDVRTFTTNESLAAALQQLGKMPSIIFHAAALCDYQVAGVEGVIAQKKLSSRSGGITLHLQPAPKILPRLREWFSEAQIVGWKYELDGVRSDAIARAQIQIQESRTDACVVNGAAYGEGFGILMPDGVLTVCDNKTALAAALVERFAT